jgi:hypothetical protein
VDEVGQQTARRALSQLAGIGHVVERVGCAESCPAASNQRCRRAYQLVDEQMNASKLDKSITRPSSHIAS